MLLEAAVRRILSTSSRPLTEDLYVNLRYRCREPVRAEPCGADDQCHQQPPQSRVFQFFFFFLLKKTNIRFANPLRQESIKFVPFLIFFFYLFFFWCFSNKLNANQWGASFCHQTCLGRNDTSKQVIVWSLGGLSRGLLWRRVHDPSQNPQLDCNQEPLAVCLTLISFLLFAFSSGCWILQDMAMPCQENKKGGMEKKNVGFAKGWNDVQESFRVWLQCLFLFSWKISKKEPHSIFNCVTNGPL